MAACEGVARLRSAPTVIARRGELAAERDPLRPTGRLLRQGDMEASYVDLADPTYLDFEYVQYLATVLETWPDGPLRGTHIGGGGLTMPRFLARAPYGAKTDPVDEFDFEEAPIDEAGIARRMGHGSAW